jgi:hypothetical protein
MTKYSNNPGEKQEQKTRETEKNSPCSWSEKVKP